MNRPPWIAKQTVKSDNWGNTKFYVSKEWRSLRKSHIESQPLCQSCLKKGTVKDCTTKNAGVVDHITPIRIGGKALDPNNLQTLCVKCHNDKTRAQSKGDRGYF